VIPHDVKGAEDEGGEERSIPITVLLQRKEMHQKVMKHHFRGATVSDQFFADFHFSGGVFEPNRR
jgi:hypothetical protein